MGNNVRTVMLSGLDKGTKGNVLLYFTEVDTGRILKWSTSSRTETAQELICTGIGNYNIPITCIERGQDVNDYTVVSHVKIRKDLMG